MSFIQRKMVDKDDVLRMARITKWIFADQIFYMALSITIIILGYAFADRGINPVVSIGFAEMPLFAIFGFVALFVTLIFWFVEFIHFISTELALTGHRVIGKKGIIAIDILDSPLDNIDTIKVQFSFLGRIFGFGNLTIITRNKDYQYRKVGRPMAFQRAVNTRREQLRKEEAASPKD